MSERIRYRRLLLKLSGEALMGSCSHGIDAQMLRYVADELRAVAELGVQLGVVVGGGNFFRGLQGTAVGMERAVADSMGMLATVMNALALSEALRQVGLEVRVQSALGLQGVAEPYVRARALHHLERGRVVILAGGTGSPFFTTDTAAALRAAELGAELLAKATKVDGIYTSDPKADSAAKRLTRLSFDEALEKRLAVMDATAFAFCREQALPVVVFSIFSPGSLSRIVKGHDEGTWVGAEDGKCG